jgi:hypothetical protein
LALTGVFLSALFVLVGAADKIRYYRARTREKENKNNKKEKRKKKKLDTTHHTKNKVNNVLG